MSDKIYTEDWVECKLGDVFLIERGGSPRPIKNYLTDGDGINWIKIGDATNSGKYILKTEQKIKSSGLARSREVVPGDVLLSNSMSFGRPYIMGIHGAIHDGWLVIRDNENINKDYLYYLLSSPETFNQFSKNAKGSTVKNLNIKIVSDVNVKITSLSIQQAIVKKIEELFSSLDNGIADLKKAKEKLKVYRLSVLKKAFEGGYTNSEIKKVELSEVTRRIGDGLHGTPKYDEKGTYYFINGNNLSDGKIEIKPNTKRVTFSEYEKHKRPLDDTTVFVSINGTIGNTAFYKNEQVVLGKSACYINVSEDLNKYYLRYNLLSSEFMNYALTNATGSTIKNVGLKTMRAYPIPIPQTLAEQHQIVKEIESRLSVCDAVEKNIEESLLKAESLRQIILKKAFEGKLLTDKEVEQCKQHPDYEPASVLLERIKEEQKSKNKKR